VLLVDIDGVLSLFGFEPNERPPGTWHLVEGIAHFLSGAAVEHLHVLAEWFEPIWCSGWEERAEHLPAMVGAPRLPHVPLGGHGRAGTSTAGHWKLDAIDAHVDRRRPLAWIDDAIDDACRAWAARRPGATLLVRTQPQSGLTGEHVERLIDWAIGQQ
jgi:hypothetical protein